tara:strand:+ start:294 stop:1043 length:750 start_codon:yes stop_codon:yes gene_type:complete
MICPWCSKEFIRSHGNQTHCSKECSKQTYRHSDKGRESQKKYRQSDKGKTYLNKWKQSDKGKEFIKKHIQSAKSKETRKKYRQSNEYKNYLQSDKYKDKQKRYRTSSKGKETKKKLNQSDKYVKWKRKYRNEYEKKRGKIDPVFKLTQSVRKRLYQFLKSQKLQKTNKTFTMVGCTPKFLREYLEKQFYPHPKNNRIMSWKNHTTNGWHVDHRKPLSLAKNIKDVEKLMHYSNLQPMWADQNIRKHNKY